jgi:hypothetical protein
MLTVVEDALDRRMDFSNLVGQNPNKLLPLARTRIATSTKRLC